MQPLPISPIDRERVYIRGDVTIHPNAAIAPGVVLQAGANSRIVIADGACLGMGVVLNAHNGNIHVKAGANLGAGVLIVGASTVGTYASIGAVSTVINSDVADDCVLPAGSVLGDRSRPMPEAQPQTAVEEDLWADTPAVTEESATSSREKTSPETNSSASEASASQPHPSERSRSETDQAPTNPTASDTVAEPPANSEPEANNSPETEPEDRDSTEAITTTRRVVYGQVHLNRMLTTLFPHANRFDSVSEDAE